MSPGDPRNQVEAPVVDALHGIVARAYIGLGVVAAASLAPLILHLEDPIHQLTHFVIPGGWVAYAAVTGGRLVLRPAPEEADPWGRAREVDADLARHAMRVSALMVVGWLAALAAVLLHHHLASPREIFVTLGIIVPLTLAAWLLGVLAWGAWCRTTLARAEHEATGRLRRYWSGVAPPGQRR
jgi:hypothetical protein